jgi:hypothetical protein
LRSRELVIVRSGDRANVQPVRKIPSSQDR